MKVKDALVQAVSRLQAAGIGTARLDSLVLLEDLTHRERSWLLAHPDFELNDTQVGRLRLRLARRARHEPLAYIRGWTEFYGRRFRVNRHVLEPRPESETMIELLKAADLPKMLSIADVGAGSGCLGITAALEIDKAVVDLYDIDSSALAVAKHNAVMHELHLHAYKRDLLSRPARSYDVILANLPYVPRNWTVNQSVKMEPRLAIDGGSDGLDVYRRFFSQLHRLSHKPGLVFTEAMPPQHVALSKIAADNGYRLQTTQDFIQVFRAG